MAPRAGSPAKSFRLRGGFVGHDFVGVRMYMLDSWAIYGTQHS